MSDAELNAKVKTGLSVSGTFNDATLLIKTVAVKNYMLNAGVTQANIETDLGIAALTVGVGDLWNLSGGEAKFSQAFDIIMTQLKVVSMPDV